MLNDIYSMVKSGLYCIRYVKETGKYQLINKEGRIEESELDEFKIVDELLANYKLQVWMDYEKCTYYTINPKMVYDYIYDEWSKNPQYKDE